MIWYVILIGAVIVVAKVIYDSAQKDDYSMGGYYSNNYKQMEDKSLTKETEVNENNNQEVGFDTLDLLESTLKDLGCQPIVDDDRENSGILMYFLYQGLRFTVFGKDDFPFFDIMCHDVYSCQMDEPDEMCFMRKTVNELNWHNPTEVLYSYDEIEREANVSMRRFVYFSREIQYRNHYLRFHLDSMISQINALRVEVIRRQSESAEAC